MSSALQRLSSLAGQITPATTGKDAALSKNPDDVVSSKLQGYQSCQFEMR